MDSPPTTMSADTLKCDARTSDANGVPMFHRESSVQSCAHSAADCPDECDGPRETWTPVVGQVFRGHGPGGVFKPDGTGGGTLTFMVLEKRQGFRPGLRPKTIRKNAHRSEVA